MKTLVNKNNPAIRITAPEIGTGTHGYYYVDSVGYHKDKWTLVEEEPEKQTSKYLKEPDYDKQVVEKMSKELAKLITDQFVEKGKRCEQQAVEEQDYENYVFWHGFQNCAENILREVEEPTEGIKGNLEETPSNVSIEDEPEKTREIRACIGYALACIPNEKIKDFGVSLKDCLDYVAPVDKGLREETVDLEREAVTFCFDNGINITPYQATGITRHFYELGLNARKEK